MRYTKYAILYLVIIACAVPGCAKKPSGDDKVIATVSSQPITIKQFNERLAKLPPYYRSIVEKNKKLYLEDMIIEKLFYEEAIRTGVLRDKEVEDLINEAKRKIVITKYIQNTVDAKIKVTDLELKEFYDSNRDDFKTPPLWRASHILVSGEDQAKVILDELAKGASFEELARKYSIDATATRGGDIGFFRIGQLVPEFEKAALKLEKGQTSGILHTQFGYHIIKLTDKREPVPESYEKVRAALEAEIKKHKREGTVNKLIKDLKSRYNVIIEKDVFGPDEPPAGNAPAEPSSQPEVLPE